MTELRDIATDQLHPHPDNPRLRLRDDVVTQIAAEITRSGFGQEHALLVRPNADGYEILSGHHRHEAAKRCSLDTVPCWVRDMDDDEAFMSLMLTNTQGEMSALEEGHHVAKYVDRSERGGRGKKGGLREYARRLNRNEATLRKRAAAYGVYEKCVHMTQYTQYFTGDSAYTDSHLREIAAAPEDCWQPLVAALVSKKWTVRDAARAVGEMACCASTSIRTR